jgi:hypothetical protein
LLCDSGKLRSVVWPLQLPKELVHHTRKDEKTAQARANSGFINVNLQTNLVIAATRKANLLAVFRAWFQTFNNYFQDRNS